MDFRVTGLPADRFRALFTMTDERLATHRAVRRIADNVPGFPCRVSLCDAKPGEEVILMHYEHQSAPTPFRASHAIYVRAAATATFDRVNEIPAMLRQRMLSVRAFDARGYMVEADLCDGREIEPLIERMLADVDVAYLHVHFAKAGCYAARIQRYEPVAPENFS